MNNSNINEPCLVETRQGFSVLYQNKPLYSKYAPKDSIKKIIDSLNILPNTLILCFSPLLAYGLEELFEKLPENCFVLALEKNKIPNVYGIESTSVINKENLIFFTTASILFLLLFLVYLPQNLQLENHQNNLLYIVLLWCNNMIVYAPNQP